MPNAASVFTVHLCGVLALRTHIALLLLFCLGRTLLPEAWVLALHPHAHTTAEPAHAPAFARKGKALVSAKHQHCEVEQFYNVAFQAAAPVVVPWPRVVAVYARRAMSVAVRPAACHPTGPLALRGPPARA